MFVSRLKRYQKLSYAIVVSSVAMRNSVIVQKKKHWVS